MKPNKITGEAMKDMKTTNAFKILYNRYIKGKPERIKSLEKERKISNKITEEAMKEAEENKNLKTVETVKELFEDLDE